MKVLTIPSIRPSSSSEVGLTGAAVIAATVGSTIACVPTAGISDAMISDAACSRTSPSTTGIISLALSGMTTASTFSGIEVSNSTGFSASFSAFSIGTTARGEATVGTTSFAIGAISLVRTSGALAGTTTSGTTAATTGAIG